MTGRYGKFIPLVFLFILLFTIADLVVTYINLNTIRSDEQLVFNTDTIRDELRNTIINLIAAESAQRSFLLTNDKGDLRTYSENIQTFNMNIETLKEMTKDDLVQQKRIIDLHATVKERIMYLQKGIDLQQAGGINADDLDLLVSEGRIAMTKASKLIVDVDVAEASLLAKRRQEAMRSYNNLYISTTITNLLGLFFVSLAFYLIWREIQARNQLERSKDDFISMASHELKTPITSLKVYASIAGKRLENAHVRQARKYMGKIEEQSNRLTNLIRDMLDMSRIQTGKLKLEISPFNLRSLIDETVEAIQETTTRHKIIVHHQLDDQVLGDRHRIYQVLINLLINAIKYSPEGGRIIVATKRLPQSVMVSVMDQGIGIPPQFRNKIFDRWYQVSDRNRKAYQGLGIGLFISSQIVKMHGGKIWVEGKKGKGSIFYFTIRQ